MNQTVTRSLYEDIAKVAHEANRVWDEVNGQQGGTTWNTAADWQRSSAVNGVKLALQGATPADLHEAWRQQKLANGWTLGPQKDPAAKTDPSLKPYNELSDLQKRSPRLVDAIAHALGCGLERWDVKTLTDPAAGNVNLQPQASTVAELIALAPPNLPTARVAQEFSTYQLTGNITFVKLEADSDVHMVLQDDAGNTMICEAVSPGCAQNSSVIDQIKAVRQAVEAQFPSVANGVVSVQAGVIQPQQLANPVPVTVSGVAFFDHPHGQMGVAPNAIELHPLLSFQVNASHN